MRNTYFLQEGVCCAARSGPNRNTCFFYPRFRQDDILPELLFWWGADRSVVKILPGSRIYFEGGVNTGKPVNNKYIVRVPACGPVPPGGYSESMEHRFPFRRNGTAGRILFGKIRAPSVKDIFL